MAQPKGRGLGPFETSKNKRIGEKLDELRKLSMEDSIRTREEYGRKISKLVRNSTKSF